MCLSEAEGEAPQDAGPVVAPMPPPVKRLPRPSMYADETVPTFFRRLSWSPDGMLLVTPTGIYRAGPDEKPDFVTHVYVRDHFDRYGHACFQVPISVLFLDDELIQNQSHVSLPLRPALILPHMPKASVAIRFCPQIFALRRPSGCEGSPQSLIRLPYRMVFAVLTLESIFIYDTQHHYPIVIVKRTHYAPLTDVAW